MTLARLHLYVYRKGSTSECPTDEGFEAMKERLEKLGFVDQLHKPGEPAGSFIASDGEYDIHLIKWGDE